MGALYGYIGNSAFDREAVRETMKRPATYWGGDNHFFYEDTRSVMGLLHRRNTPEAAFEQQPTITLQDTVLFFNGRIDNRQELCDDTRIRNGQDVPDGTIASQIWQKYGNDAVHHIEGDWVMVVWNSSLRRLTILRDHHGYSSLYYFKGNHFFAFATSIKSLIALNEIPKKPNIKRVVQAVTSWQGDGLESGYAGIMRLPPAHFMEVDDTFNVSLSRHWFPEKVKQLYYKREGDYYDHFFAEYYRAVEVRLRSARPVGSQLSGGLDSGTVVSLAAMILKKDGVRLPVFTHTPVFNTEDLTSANRFGDEGRLAKMTADFTGNCEWIPVPATNANPFEAIREGVEIHNEPFHAGANTFWINEIKRQAQAMGLGTMLTGQGGNATVSWPTPGFLQIMSRKTNLIKFRHFFSNAGWRHTLLPLIAPAGIKNLIQKRKKGPLPFLQYSALRKDYAIENKVLDQMLEDGHNPWFTKPSSPLETRLKIIKPGSSIVGFLHSQSAAWSDLEMRDPTFDKRLVEYCLAVPDSIYVAGGKDRLLIRKSFDGKMPPEVLWNTMRGRQSADIGHRVVQFSRSGYLMLEQMERSALCREILDIERMRRILDSLHKEVNTANNTAAGTILLRGITAGLFLMSFDA